MLIGALITASLYSAALPAANAGAQNKEEMKFITKEQATEYAKQATRDFMRNHRENLKNGTVTEAILLQEVSNLIQKYGFIKDAGKKL